MGTIPTLKGWSRSTGSSSLDAIVRWINSHYAVVLLAIAGICAALLGFGLDQIFLRHVGHDQSWCIYAADLVLHGVQLDGPMLIESNPPFIIWFSCLPVLLGHALHVGPLDGFRVFFDGLAVITIAWSTSQFRRMRASELSVLGFLILQIAVAFLLIRQDSLGQREHMLVLLMVPYLVLAGSRLERNPIPVSAGEAVLIGLAAAVAIALKPQHVIAVVLVEVVLAIRYRSLRTGGTATVVAFASGILAYLAAVRVFGWTYFTNVVPLLRLAYWGLNHPYRTVIREAEPVLMGLLLCAAVILLLRRRMRFSGLVWALALAALGSTLAYVQQHKGWTYQLIPAGLFILLSLGIAALGLIDDRLDEPAHSHAGRPLRGVPLLLGFTAVAVLTCLAGWRYGHHSDYFNAKKRELAGLYATCPPGTAVAYLSTEPWDMPLVLEQHKVLGQRVNHLWPLPAAILAEDPGGNELHHTMSAADIARLTAFERTSTAEDLNRWKPAMVVVDECGPDLCPSLHREHYATLLSWFLADAAFRRAWQDYAPSSRVGDLDVFRRIQ